MDASTNKRGSKARGTVTVLFRRVTIPNTEGTARAASAHSCAAAGFKAEIRVTREGHTVGGTSIMGLMMLPSVRAFDLIEAEGATLAPHRSSDRVVESGFGEDD
jgi:phosphocarrier protein